VADQFTHRGRSYGAADITTYLVTAEAALDRDDATEFLLALPGALKQKAGEVLGEFIARGLPRHVVFAAQLLATVPAVPAADLWTGLKRTDLPSDGLARFSIAVALEREVFAHRGKHDAWLRTQAGVPGYSYGLVAMFLAFDTDWALDHLAAALGSDPTDASIGLRGALAQMGPTEARALAGRLRGNLRQVDSTTRANLETDLNEAGL
jgi:hypothetical protein